MTNGTDSAINDLTGRVIYLAPFIGLGAAGGVIRELNTKSFTWKELCTRAVTGAFGAALAGLWLKHTAYSIEAQFAIAGAIGTTSCELIKAVQNWIETKLGGKLNDLFFEESDGDIPRMDTTDTDTGDSNIHRDTHNEATGDNNPCTDCYTDECSHNSGKDCKRE